MNSEPQNKIRVMSNEQLKKASECLKTVCHPARLKMVQLLLQSELNVNTIASECKLPPSQTCEHLRLMQSRGLLKSRRDGRIVYYSVAHPGLPELIRCIDTHCLDQHIK